MAAQGSGGAFEISQRMTAMVGWGATTDFREDWTWCVAGGCAALFGAVAHKSVWELNLNGKFEEDAPGVCMVAAGRLTSSGGACSLAADRSVRWLAV